MLTSTLLLAFEMACFGQSAPIEQAPSGLFALSHNIEPLPERILNEKSLAGISLRGGWNAIEPRRGEFNWLFDAEIARARAAGKKVMLRVSAGDKTPDWVYALGARKFEFLDSNRFHAGAGGTLTMPIPWDPIFLAEWSRLVRALGERYGGDETVVLVQMGGPTSQGGEMHLPKTPADKKHWRRIGYSKEKLVDAWKAALDAYAAAFPSKHLAIDVQTPVFKDGVVEAVLAYGEQAIGRRFCVQHNILSARTNVEGPVHQWVVSQKGKAVIGFQLLSSASTKGRFNGFGSRFGGTLAQGLRIGLDAGGSYFEIYPADYEDPSSAAALHNFGRQLNSPR